MYFHLLWEGKRSIISKCNFIACLGFDLEFTSDRQPLNEIIESRLLTSGLSKFLFSA